MRLEDTRFNPISGLLDYSGASVHCNGLVPTSYTPKDDKKSELHLDNLTLQLPWQFLVLCRVRLLLGQLKFRRRNTVQFLVEGVMIFRNAAGQELPW